MLRFHRTFPISNLTPGPRLGFPRLAFSYQESHLGFFFLILFFPFKIKTKISGDSKPFFLNGFPTTHLKSESRPLSGDAYVPKNAGPHTTRPDISYVVHQVSQFMSSPRHLHLAAVRRIIHYLRGSPSRGLFFSY